MGDNFPLIALINTDIPCFRVHPCSSVGGYVSLPLSSVGEAVIIVRAHRRDKNGCLCCLLNQPPSLFLVWKVFSLDSLDFCEFASKDVYIPFSVSIRAHPWLAYLPPRAPSPSILSRYIPDTYPTHTRYIYISHEYPTNTPRIPHEYPKALTNHLLKC